ncbi:MAG: trehalose-phosphatase [Elusimicrobia bacterium]|nr:trehalose-phosphatase [Elusimicrobiota bacterium]
MENFWRSWPGLRRRLSRARKVLFLLDFDGTLSPLAPLPEKARIPEGVRRTLLGLLLPPHVHVAILSGRPVAYLARCFEKRGFVYGGNHGLEMKGPDWHYKNPKGEALRPLIQKLAARFRVPVWKVPGARLENKGFSLSLHYRRVPHEHMDGFHRLVGRFRERTGSLPVRWMEGHKVWELLPGVAWDKGRAARALLKRFSSPFSIALGDDRTDEDMFRALKGRGITVQVGRKRGSFAGYYLNGQAEVPRFLREMKRVLT